MTSQSLSTTTVLRPSQGHESQQMKSSLITHAVTQKWLARPKVGIAS